MLLDVVDSLEEAGFFLFCCSVLQCVLQCVLQYVLQYVLQCGVLQCVLQCVLTPERKAVFPFFSPILYFHFCRGTGAIQILSSLFWQSVAVSCSVLQRVLQSSLQGVLQGVV